MAYPKTTTRFSFPVQQVEALTGVVFGDERHSDFKNLSYDALEALVGIHATKLKSQQNDSPTIRKFLKVLGEYKEKVTFEGYVIWPPRDDARVTIDGFTISNITLSLFGDFKRLFKNADTIKPNMNHDGSVTVRFWWD